MAKLRHLPFEVFSCLFLDNRHRVIEFEELFRGTIDGTSVHAREVVRRALNHNAAAVIFAHNHPSGVAEPSQADRLLTDQLVAALAMVEVTVGRPPHRRRRGLRLLRRSRPAVNAQNIVTIHTKFRGDHAMSRTTTMTVRLSGTLREFVPTNVGRRPEQSKPEVSRPR